MDNNNEQVIISLPPITLKFRRHGTKIFRKIGKRLVFFMDNDTVEDAIDMYQKMTERQDNKKGE